MTHDYDPRRPDNAGRVEVDLVRDQLDRWYQRRGQSSFGGKMLLLVLLIGVSYFIDSTDPVVEFAAALALVVSYLWLAGRIEDSAQARFERANPYPLAPRGHGDRAALLDVRR